MSIRIYVPRDSAAVALGANHVVKALQYAIASEGHDAVIVRNGSRGMHWLEPLVEVETPEGRIAYGPVKASDVEPLIEAGLLEGKAGHPLYLGPDRRHSVPQEPDTSHLRPLRRHRPALALPTMSPWRAEGPALSPFHARRRHCQGSDRQRPAWPWRRGFPDGIKWNTVLHAKASQKYIVCNADEGDSATSPTA